MSSQNAGCTLLSDYENFTKAGYGGFGSVLRAKKKDENFYSAIKLVPIDVGRDTLSEAKKVSRISKHDSVVACLSYWEDACTKAEYAALLRMVKISKNEQFFHFPTNAKELKFLCIRMEFCENGTLKNWLKNRSHFDVSENIQIFLQIARGIEHIHTHKLIHRDLKPANILFDKKNAKISDFGWSAIHNVGEYQHTPRAGAALYQAPEQACGKYGQTTDYYALGLILFELFYPAAQQNIGLALTNLKYTREIPKEIAHKYPVVGELIKKLVSVESSERPYCAHIVTIIKQLLDTSIPKSDNNIQSNNNKCNGCLITMTGIRYKCCTCSNFFLCQSCEQEDEGHTETHNFIKIKKFAAEPSANDNHGCQHYRRKCKLKCPISECGSSNGFYFCRFCHDDDIKGHKMDRFRIQEILCTYCGMKQFPRSTCLLCMNSFSKYFCSTCNLFDDSEEANSLIFHCFLCGICRKKSDESIEYKHCDRCSMCYPCSIIIDGQTVSTDFEHECNKETGKIPCSVCHKNIHDSREAAVLVDCHHYVHKSCRTKFPDNVSDCPSCGNW